MAALDDLLADARRVVPELAPADAGCGRTLIDVRDSGEVERGAIADAIHLRRSDLELRIGAVVADITTPITLYCATGVRSLMAARSLRELGYSDVASMAGGYRAWVAGGLPTTAAAGLSDEQLERYSRHLLLPEIGVEGQRRLLAARVLIVGVGGLGCPAALYLAAAGVGTLDLVDGDTVELSNLQRQVLHSETSIGRPKTESAATALRRLNGATRVECHPQRLTADNAEALFGPCDVAINGCDNFPTRYLANDVAVLSGTPLVDGAVHRFEGQVTTVLPGHGPCYRCRHPLPPPASEAPSCAEAGVLGVLPGLIGLLQAMEAIKLICGIGEPLVGRLLLVDGLSARMTQLAIPRDPDCPVCGTAPSITAPVDYERLCGSGSAPTA